MMDSITYKFYDEEGHLIEELAKYKYIDYSDDEKYYLFELEENGKNYIGILDNEYNEIFKIEGNDFGSFYVKNNHYYFEYESVDGTTKLLYLISYDVLEGGNQQYNNNDLVVKFNGSTAFLNKIYVNGEELASDNRTITQGSTIVTLKKAYLETLKSGNYTLKVEYKDGGSAEATFTIPENNPKTGDRIMISILFGSIGIIGLIGCAMFLNKKGKNINI